MTLIVEAGRQGGGDKKAPEGYLGFQVTGMIKGFFGFEIFDSGMFFWYKILASIDPSH